MTKAWVVRIILEGKDTKIIWGLLDCLRHPGGIVQVHQNEQRQVFDINRPKHISKAKSKAWAEDVAMRMRTFALNAAAAPAWVGGDPEVTDA